MSELIEAATTSWKEDLARTMFTPIDAEVILKIPLCTRRLAEFCAWSEEPRGNFSVSSTYRMLLRTKLNWEGWLEGRVETSHHEEGNEWKALWKLQVPSKLEFSYGAWLKTLYRQGQCLIMEIWQLLRHVVCVELMIRGGMRC